MRNSYLLGLFLSGIKSKLMSVARGGDLRRTVARSTSSSSSLSASGTNTSESVGQLLHLDRENMDELLQTIPSSPKALLAKIERQRDQLRLLQQENVRLRAKEVEVSSMTVQLQQYFNATQNQVDRLKHEVHAQLSNPIDEEEYKKLEASPEADRDLLDTIKLGIYRQLGSLRASLKAATQRAAELSAELGKLREENAELKLLKSEYETLQFNGKEEVQKKSREADRYRTRVAELEGAMKDMEGKLKSFYTDQEQFLSAKLAAQVKTDEVARLAVRLEEAELELASRKTSAECSEQKLDILKSEYYELKLKYTQRIQELESALKASDEKLKMFSDLEMESELFISNLSEHVDGSGRLTLETNSGGSSSLASHFESYIALPRSRKLTHSLMVTKRCLHLENKVQLLTRDVKFRDQQIAKLQGSLDAARQALNNINSPYLLLEKTLDQLCSEKDELEKKVDVLENDNAILRNRLKQRNTDIQILCKHRNDLLHMKKLLRRTGVNLGVNLDALAQDQPELPKISAVDLFVGLAYARLTNWALSPLAQWYPCTIMVFVCSMFVSLYFPNISSHDMSDFYLLSVKSPRPIPTRRFEAKQLCKDRLKQNTSSTALFVGLGLPTMQRLNVQVDSVIRDGQELTVEEVGEIALSSGKKALLEWGDKMLRVACQCLVAGYLSLSSNRVIHSIVYLWDLTPRKNTYYLGELLKGLHLPRVFASFTGPSLLPDDKAYVFSPGSAMVAAEDSLKESCVFAAGDLLTMGIQEVFSVVVRRKKPDFLRFVEGMINAVCNLVIPAAGATVGHVVAGSKGEFWGKVFIGSSAQLCATLMYASIRGKLYPSRKSTHGDDFGLTLFARNSRSCCLRKPNVLPSGICSMLFLSSLKCYVCLFSLLRLLTVVADKPFHIPYLNLRGVRGSTTSSDTTSVDRRQHGQSPESHVTSWRDLSLRSLPASTFSDMNECPKMMPPSCSAPGPAVNRSPEDLFSPIFSRAQLSAVKSRRLVPPHHFSMIKQSAVAYKRGLSCLPPHIFSQMTVAPPLDESCDASSRPTLHSVSVVDSLEPQWPTQRTNEPAVLTDGKDLVSLHSSVPSVFDVMEASPIPKKSLEDAEHDSAQSLCSPLSTVGKETVSVQDLDDCVAIIIIVCTAMRRTRDHFLPSLYAAVTLLFLLEFRQTPVQAEEGSPVHQWGFIGEGFHMQFFIDFSLANGMQTLTFDLPNSFFIDTAEAAQSYTIKMCSEGRSLMECDDITEHFEPLQIQTAYLCDIEAPVFKVADSNQVTIALKKAVNAPRMIISGKLIFPIHARYEELNVEQAFDLQSLLVEENSYVTRCMNAIHASSGMTLEAVEVNSTSHCRMIPVGNLSDLHFVYTSLMGLLVFGAVLVVLSLSLVGVTVRILNLLNFIFSSPLVLLFSLLGAIQIVQLNIYSSSIIFSNFQGNELSPLLQYHNLNYVSSGVFLYASNSCVASCNPSSGRITSFFAVTDHIHSIRSSLTPKDFLRNSLAVVTTPSAVYIISEKGVVSTLPINIGADGLGCCAAVCAAAGSNSSLRLMAGTSSGKILFSQCTVDSTGATLTPCSAANIHKAAITTLDINPWLEKDSILAVSGDSAGNLLLWGQSHQVLKQIPSPGDCVTDIALCVAGKRVAASYGSGKIRFYSVEGSCEVEICAHAKWINALAYNSASHLLVSAAEDGVLNVWDVNPKQSTPVTHKCSASLAGGIPTGAAFNHSGESLLITMYGSSVVQMFNLPNKK
eukprot:gene10852-7518_t